MAYDQTHAKYMPSRHCCSCGSNGLCNLCGFPHEEHSKCKNAEHGQHSEDCMQAYHSAALASEEQKARDDSKPSPQARTFERIDTEKLEKMVDTYGLRNVLDTLAAICFAKSQHIEENWQDSGRDWMSDGKRLERFLVRVDQAGYSRTLGEVMQ